MAHGTKEGVDTVDTDDPRYRWPQTLEAAKMAGVSKRTLENLVRSGKVGYVYDDSGERHFDPEGLRLHAGVVSDADVELDLTKATWELVRRTNSDLVKANSDLLKLATEPSFKLIAALQAELEAVRNRYDALQAKYIASIDAFEAALTTAHERELAREQARAQDARKDMGFKMALDQLPNLVAQLTFKKSIDGLFESLTPEQTAVLFDLLTEKQKAVVMTIMKQRAEGPKGNGASHSTVEWSDDN
jgi:hypothetical protein